MFRAIPRLTLRPLEADDAAIMAKWGDDHAFRRAATWSTDLSHDALRRFFDQLIATPPHGLVRLAAVLESKVVGYVDLREDRPAVRELGFLIGERNSWGRGLGRSAAAADCRYGFRELGLRSIWAEAASANPASIRVLRAIGMQELETGETTQFSEPRLRSRRFEISVQAWSTRP